MVLSLGLFGSEAVSDEFRDLYSIYNENNLEYLLEQTLDYHPDNLEALHSRLTDGPDGAGGSGDGGRWMGRRRGDI